MDWNYPIICLLSVCVSVCELVSPAPPVMYGEVQSPLYPQPYHEAQYEQWELEVPDGYTIQLSFTHLDIEPSADCYYDSLTVMYDQKVLGKFCGQENSADGHHPGNKPIVSPGNRLLLVFQTDDSNPGPHQHLGFSAFYQAVDVDECSNPGPDNGMGLLCSQICHNTLGSYLCSCHHGYELRPDQRTCVLHCGGGVFSEPEGTISSPGYPSPSPHGLSCRYHISVEPGFIITLNFTGKFHIEQIDNGGPTCLFHWLEMSISGREPQKLCGGQSPGLIPTQTHSVQLEYRTDEDGLSNGWSLHYTTQRVKCESPKRIAHGRVTPSFEQYVYRDYIQVRCDPGYKLMKEGNEIESYMSMCQSDGQWHTSLPECHIIDCGEPTPLLNGGVRFLSGTKNQHQSVIDYHCNEPYYSFSNTVNVSYTCAADRKWRENDNNDIIPPCLPVCGRPTVTVSGRQRVMKGKEAPAGSIPWQVFLTINGRGGAAVIGDRWIMTAAHNFRTEMNTPVPMEKVKVYVGDISVEKMLKSPSLGVASIHIHPLFINQDRKDMNNDIALIKLTETITFNADVMPLCLPPGDDKYNTDRNGFVSGFGITDDSRIANILRYVQLPLVDQVKCRNSIDTQRKKSSDISIFTDTMFCAGLPEGGEDTCQGDSGGAFVLEDDDRFWAAGIVSWGIGCGEGGKYGVYTRVSRYLDWIEKTMKGN